MRKAKIEKIRKVFGDAMVALERAGIKQTNCACYKCKHSCMPFEKRKKCNTCEGFELLVYTNFEDVME
jgi:hypothetical protein